MCSSDGRSLDGVLFRHAASGIVLSYSMTPLSAWFLMVFGLIAIPVAVYSVGYFAHSIAPSRMAAVGTGFNVMLGAVDSSSSRAMSSHSCLPGS